MSGFGEFKKPWVKPAIKCTMQSGKKGEKEFKKFNNPLNPDLPHNQDNIKITIGNNRKTKLDSNGALWSHLSDARYCTTKNNYNLMSAINHYKCFVYELIKKAGAENLSEYKIVEKMGDFYKGNDDVKMYLRTFVKSDLVPNISFSFLTRSETEPFILITRKPEDAEYVKDYLNNTPNVFIEAARTAEALLESDKDLDHKVRLEIEQQKNLWWILGVKCLKAEIPSSPCEDLAKTINYIKVARNACYKTHNIPLLNEITELILSIRMIEDSACNPLAQFELYIHSAIFYLQKGEKTYAWHLLMKAKSIMAKAIKEREEEVLLFEKGFRHGVVESRFILSLERLMRWYKLASDLYEDPDFRKNCVYYNKPVKESEIYFRNLYFSKIDPTKLSDLDKYMKAMKPFIVELKKLWSTPTRI